MWLHISFVFRFGLPVTARTVLWYMTFIGFIVNYMIRINLNITIVDMIVGHGAANDTAGNNTALANSSALAALPEFRERFSLERWFLDWANVSIRNTDSLVKCLMKPLNDPTSDTLQGV